MFCSSKPLVEFIRLSVLAFVGSGVRVLSDMIDRARIHMELRRLRTIVAGWLVDEIVAFAFLRCKTCDRCGFYHLNDCRQCDLHGNSLTERPYECRPCDLMQNTPQNARRRERVQRAEAYFVHGMREFEHEFHRVFFPLDRARVEAVYSNGVFASMQSGAPSFVDDTTRYMAITIVGLRYCPY